MYPFGLELCLCIFPGLVIFGGIRLYKSLVHQDDARLAFGNAAARALLRSQAVRSLLVMVVLVSAAWLYASNWIGVDALVLTAFLPIIIQQLFAILQRKMDGGALAIWPDGEGSIEGVVWLGLFSVFNIQFIYGLFPHNTTSLGLPAALPLTLIILSMVLILIENIKHTQVTRSGIHFPGLHLYWREIDCYSWKDNPGKPSTLNLLTRPHKLFGRSFISMEIPLGQKDYADQLLSQYLPDGSVQNAAHEPAS